ncbi:MAG: ABC transporter ATP-binding protein [Roseiflexaceae bacterium]
MFSSVIDHPPQANTAPVPPSTSVALATTQHARRIYQRGAATVVALQDATCMIAPGDRIALVGRSGSGKSTLLHLLGGLDTPTSGTVAWPALGARDSLRPTKVAFVFQMPSLLPPLTVIENVELPLLLGGADPLTARTAAQQALEQMGLAALADQLPEELSGGQAQRVAVARALAYRPRLILADEPTGQLDRPTAQHLFDVLLAALAGTDTALVVATHDLAVADRMQHAWQMRQGILEGAA